MSCRSRSWEERQCSICEQNTRKQVRRKGTYFIRYSRSQREHWLPSSGRQEVHLSGNQVKDTCWKIPWLGYGPDLPRNSPCVPAELISAPSPHIFRVQEQAHHGWVGAASIPLPPWWWRWPSRVSLVAGGLQPVLTHPQTKQQLPGLLLLNLLHNYLCVNPWETADAGSSNQGFQ